jgi:Flp pilus assembly protein TadG
MPKASCVSSVFALVRAFRRRSEGSVVSMFALSMVPLIGVIGAATDYSRADTVRSGLRTAIDAAVLAGARDGTANWGSVALTVFNANFQRLGASIGAPAFTKADDGSYVGSVSGSVASSFMKLMGISVIPVAVQSRVKVSGASSGQYCLFALSKSAQPALQLTGNSSIQVNAPNCVLQVNSSSNNAVTLNGNTSISSVDNCVVGGVSKVGNAALYPPQRANCQPVNDVFASYPRPAVGPCDHTNYSTSANGPVTLNPGVYCGGMKFTGKPEVTFSPGLYIIKDGALEASGGSSFTGLGVTFFLTGAGAAVQISGQANWKLVAPTAGPLAGFVFFLDRNGPSGLAATSSQLSGQGQIYFEGVVYLPQQVTLSGGAQMETASPYTAYVTDTLNVNGNGTLVINSDPTKTAVPIPAALQVQINGQPRLVM